MDRGRASNYSAAYKMTSRTGENKNSQRLRRRSVEQKQQRELHVEKRRRPLAGLTPLEEEPNTQDVSYKEKTPGKKAGMKDKENSLLQRLQIWKEARDRKRQEEMKNKKGSFRVSRNVDRSDSTLYKTSTVGKKASIQTKAGSSQKISKVSSVTPSKAVSRHTTAASQTGSSRATAPKDHSTSRAPEKAGPTSTKAVSKMRTKMSPSQVKLANTRHASRSKTVAEPPVTRQSARIRDQKETCKSIRPEARMEGSRQRTVTAPKSVVEPKQPTQNLTQVNTRRPTVSSGEYSFAPPDFTFDASSFVFTPLSPTSAAHFLFPGQSADKMQSKPKCSSTPKEPSCPKRASKGSENVTTRNQEEQQARLQSISEFGTNSSLSTNSGYADQWTVKLPNGELMIEGFENRENGNAADVSVAGSAKRHSRRSVRRSINTENSDSSAIVKDSDSLENGHAVGSARRSSRRSINTVNSHSPAILDVDSGENGHAVDTPARRRSRRSIRRSINMDNLDSQERTASGCDANTESEVTENKDRKLSLSSRRTSRASGASAVSLTPRRGNRVSGAGTPGDKTVVPASPVSVPVSTGKSARRCSLRKSLLQSLLPQVEIDSTEDTQMKSADKDKENNETAITSTSSHVESPKKRRRISNQAIDREETPYKQHLRRSRRRSLATPRVDNIPEAMLEQDESAPECIENPVSMETSSEAEMRGQDMTVMQTMGHKAAGKASVAIQKTPTSTRNTSFGGFRLPDSGSTVLSLSARRRTSNRSKTPKSPEEWVELLNNSPMVEMSRRKPKQGNMSLPALKFDEFDDVDFDDADQVAELERSISQSEEESSSSSTEEAAGSQPESSSSSTEEAAGSQPESSGSSTEEVAGSQPADGTNSHSTEEAQSDCSNQSERLNAEESGEHDVPYFRNLMVSETKRLNNSCAYWELMNASLKLSEDLRGQIRTTVGQAQLLIDQRFKQFSGLVDNCEFKTGEKETTCMDLQGFWDMVYFQVEDVDAKFAQLTKLQANNWVDDTLKPEVKPIKKKVTKPVTKKPAAGRSKFAAFRAQMKKQKEEVAGSSDVMGTEKKTFEIPGFFQVTSPVRSPKPHCPAGSPAKGPTPAGTPKIPSAPSSSSGLSGTRTPLRRSFAPIVPSPLTKMSDPPSLDSKDNDRGTRKTPRRSVQKRKSVRFPEDNEMVSLIQSDLLSPTVTPAGSANVSVFDQDNGSPRVEPSSETTPQRRSTRNKSRPSLLYTPPKSTCAVTPSKDIPTGVLISFSP